MKGMGASAFTFSEHMEDLLFQNFNIKNAGGIVGVCLGLIVLSFMLEGVKLIREYLLIKTNASCCQQMPNESSQLTLCGSQLSQQTRIVIHFVQTFLHVLQILFGYILMLCVMSFNAWFIIAAVIGLTIGYFMCGAILRKQFSEADFSSQTPMASASPSYSSTTVVE